MARAVVTGAAGFLGSHLVDRLLADGHDVVGVDSMLTGRADNLRDAVRNDRFELVRADLRDSLPVDGPVDLVFHLASPASPKDYARWPIETLEVGSFGTRNALELARRTGARFLLSSTSEVYGDPEVVPQPETYWGRVNPIGPRSCYDEAKRFAEALTVAYRRVHGVETRIARIFNTYGPRMRLDDGRVVPTFIRQALEGEPVVVHGNGTQTRSFCFVTDLIEGLARLMTSDEPGPVNLGSPDEFRIIDLAHLVAELAGSASTPVFTDRPVDDPERRRPDIALARRALAWTPTVDLRQGLKTTIAAFAGERRRP